MEVTTAHILSILKRRTGTLDAIVMIITPVAFIVGGVIWYYDHVWKPEVTVLSTDYVNGSADLMINGAKKTLYTGSTISAGHGWGVRFSGDENTRIELVKNDLSYQTLSMK